MADVLDELFTTEALDRLRAKANPSITLKQRIAILTAAERADADVFERCWQRVLLARRAAWATYVTSMRDIGSLEADVSARLISVDDDDFRSAMSECLTGYFLRQHLGLVVFGRPEGRPGRVLDFGIRRGDGDLNIDVKSPYADPPVGSTWSGDHSQLLVPLIDIANKQFAEGRRNVLIIAPLVEFPVLLGRMPYVKAFFGETNVVFTVDTRTGGAVDKPKWEFMVDYSCVDVNDRSFEPSSARPFVLVDSVSSDTVPTSWTGSYR